MLRVEAPLGSEVGAGLPTTPAASQAARETTTATAGVVLAPICNLGPKRTGSKTRSRNTDE